MESLGPLDLNPHTDTIRLGKNIHHAVETQQIRTPDFDAGRAKLVQRITINFNWFAKKNTKSHQKGNRLETRRHIIYQHPNIRKRSHRLGTAGRGLDRNNKLVVREHEASA